MPTFSPRALHASGGADFESNLKRKLRQSDSSQQVGGGKNYAVYHLASKEMSQSLTRIHFMWA